MGGRQCGAHAERRVLVCVAGLGPAAQRRSVGRPELAQRTLHRGSVKIVLANAQLAQPAVTMGHTLVFLGGMGIFGISNM